jgi:beta-glucosidase
VSIELDQRAFAFYHTGVHDWLVESGDFEVLAGPSSVETPLRARVHVLGTRRPFARVGRKTKFFELLAQPETAATVGAVIEERLERLKAQAIVASTVGGARPDTLARLEAIERRVRQADLRSLAGLMVRMPERDLEILIATLNAQLGI